MSRVRLFADDTIVYLTIKSHSSAQSQENLHNLELWKKDGQWNLTLTSVKYLEYTEKETGYLPIYTS